METLLKFIVDNHLGEICSVLGVIIAIVGFCLTIRSVWRARQIAQKVRDDIAKITTIEEFSAALMTMNEIKTLNREGALSILPERCSALRKSLISIKNNTPHLSDDYKAILQGAIQHFLDIETSVERAIKNGAGKLDYVRVNKIISKQVDNLNEILNKIKSALGR